MLIITDGVSLYPVTWSSNRLRRVCNSSQQAEIMAANEGTKDLFYVVAMMEELTGRKIPTKLFTDNKNMFISITSTTAPTDKRTRVELASLREACMNGELGGIKHISSKQMLADCLTKRGAPSDRLLAIIQTGRDNFGEKKERDD